MSAHDFGFAWGPMDVSRIMTAHKGDLTSRVLGVTTDHHKVEVVVSKTGRSVRVWIDGKEVKP